MFNQIVDDRISSWIDCRNKIENTDDPLQYVWDFWHPAPFIPYNKKIDPYYQQSWPSPWEIIADNKYDDFTLALMIGWTLKLTKKFADSKIELKTFVDTDRTSIYNLIYVNEDWVINYSDNGPIPAKDITGSFRLENLIEVNTPR